MVTLSFKSGFFRGVVTVAYLSKEWTYANVSDIKNGRKAGVTFMLPISRPLAV
jgi:hypothetical protein